MEDMKVSIGNLLKKIEHPEIAYTLFDLGMIKNINIQEKKVSLTLKVPMLGVPIKDYLINSIKEAVKKENKDIEVEIDVEEMDDSERTKFIRMAREAWRDE